MTITITAFARSPNGGKGLARDTRVRWALEEVGRPYEVRLVSFRAMKEPAHRRFILSARFATYEEGDLALLETRVDRLPYRRAPCGPTAERCRYAGARDHITTTTIARSGRRVPAVQVPSPGAKRGLGLAFGSGRSNAAANGAPVVKTDDTLAAI